MSCQHSVSLGVYVLGALEPGERSAMERHLTGCPFCQQELVRFAPLPGLLGRISLDDLATLEHDPTASGPPGRGARAARETTLSVPRHMVPEQQRSSPVRPQVPPASSPPASPQTPRRHRRTSRRQFAFTAAGIIAAVAVSAVLVERSLAGPSGPQQPSATWQATDSTTKVVASADLTNQLWGTEVRLSMRNLPKDQVCQLVVHNRNGQTQSAGWWRNGQETEGDVPASTSFALKDIDRMDVVTADNKLLVDLSPKA
ncbi:anti-sigma factor RsiW [Kutzneria viridogrisea]|uniref:Anti-sigma factor RsiW n=1 Tax=Kutzneria viridogrisea TaxID=47990 RepID=A0ABR6BG55_9PSEU|nr:anti-sigma factor RsiW [Kutzneria viridogrisea]